jgi:hypothetical protein
MLGVEYGGRTQLWLTQQLAYDLGQARQSGIPNIKPLHRRLAA